MKSWLKGGLIGLGYGLIGSILFLIGLSGSIPEDQSMLAQTSRSNLYNYLSYLFYPLYAVTWFLTDWLSNYYDSSIVQLLAFPSLLIMPLITGFAIGAFIGWIIGRLKK